MRIKYTGLEPVTNIFGDWKTGDVKIIDKDISGTTGFVKVEGLKTRIYEKPLTEKLNDKSDKKSRYIKKEGGNK